MSRLQLPLMRTLLVSLVVAALMISGLSAKPLEAEANVPVEIEFQARKPHTDPFNEVILDVLFTDPSGAARKVPAFWAGGDRWKVRYASPLPGSHPWRTICSDATDPGLQDVAGVVEVRAYTGDNPLYQHGPLRTVPGQRHLEYADGTPFFWLGDTWWMGLCHRLHWPGEFQQLAADRKAKGFNVIQIVAGLYPDMHPFDPRGANEAGFPWEKDYARIRPEYFDAADARLRHLVEQGFTPCLVGAWGYFLPWMGEEKMQAHWRYLIARYGAWPIVWCAAGEANLPWYLAKHFPSDDRDQVHGWTNVLRFIRATDPFRRPLTIHPTAIHRYTARHATDDPSLLDFDLLQTPHGQREVVPIAIQAVRESYAAAPSIPVINGEASYEMLSDRLPTQWTRAMFWLCMMSGASGHTYGANGIWQLNRPGQPHGASPHGTGNGYGLITWEEASRLPGATQVGLGRRFFESLPWTRLTPMPDSVGWADAADSTPMGSWIWFPEGDPKRDAPLGARYFRRSFQVPDPTSIRRAILRVAADDQMTVWLNGKEIGSSSTWREPLQRDITGALQPGLNLLAIRAENVASPVTANPAGLTVSLKLVSRDGTETEVPSDASWRAAATEQEGWREAAFPDEGWPAALVTAAFGEPPWGSPGTPHPLDAPQACGIGDTVRVIYALDIRPIAARRLTPGATYRVTYFDPVTGTRTRTSDIVAEATDEHRFNPPQHGHDWVLLLEKQP